MKTILTTILFLTFNFSAFAQIDTSAWKGKTVLVWVKDFSYSSDTLLENSKIKLQDWYLTDSVNLLTSTFAKRNLDSFGEDTVIIIWTREWQKVIEQRGCFSVDYNNCLIWTLTQKIEFKNFQNQNWETYVFPSHQRYVNPINQFQQYITTLTGSPSYDNKTIVLTNQNYTAEVNLLIKEKFKNSDLKMMLNVYNYTDYQKDDAIFIYQQQNSLSDYVEVVDLKTNRVIEKIKIE